MSEARTLNQAVVATHPLRILFAEDSPEMRDMVCTSLRKDGYEVWALPDGAALLEAFETAPRARVLPELIVSDVRMPELSGLEVLARIRVQHGDLPVILITAFGDEATHAQAKSLGAIVLDKPFDLQDLREAILNLKRRET